MADTDHRRDLVRSLLRFEVDADLLLITDLANIRYLTGFSGSNAVLLLGSGADDDLIGTDGRYRDQVLEQSPDLKCVIDRDTLSAILDVAPAGRLGIEATLPVGALATIRQHRDDPVIAPPVIERLRATKDPTELSNLARACAVTVAALTALISEIRVGMTERALARRLEQLFGELGAEDRAFDTIVGSGPNSAIPHHRPGSRQLEPGDLLVIDAGAQVNGYHADMTRTFVVADSPVDWQRTIHGVVAQAQAASAQEYRGGASALAVYETSYDIIGAAGHAENFTHGLGHGVGLQIHESPVIGMRSTATLGVDMAITVEPGIYLPGRGGVRIEDTLVVTDAGPRVLTEAPRDLVVVG